MARTRHVFDTDMVAHVWAQRGQDNGRNKQDNFYFVGDTIYSYGGHFPIATFCKSPRKGAADFVAFTYRGYSSTTSGHIHITRRAIPARYPIVNVKDPVAVARLCRDLANLGKPDTHKRLPDIVRSQLGDLRADYNERIADLLDKASRARTRKDEHFMEAQALARETQYLARTFKRPAFAITLPDTVADAVTQALAQADKHAKAQARAHKRAQAKQQREDKARYES